MARIIVSFDGTWNTPSQNPKSNEDSSTNVWKLHDAILAKDSTKIVQKSWYEAGVGTNWYDKFTGGAFGVGLSEKIQEGYKHLVETYKDGDEIFVFGFSRGAYTARSLIGLIRNSGLLKKENINHIADAYSLYRTRDGGADTENAKFFRNKFSREITIHFLGVWDTVGALGIPVESFEWFNKSYYQFHDTELSGIVKNAYQAVAIDEHRKTYQCTLWDPKEKPNQNLEQAWFSGAHANIGGGYAQNSLSDVTLLWMMEKAQSCGLALDNKKKPTLSKNMSPVIDSYAEFLDGTYSLFEPRYFRTIGTTPNGQEQIDMSVFLRTEADANYRPRNDVGPNLTGDKKPVGRIRK